MVFTRRFLYLVGFGVVPLLLSGLYSPLALLGVLWNLVLVALALVDYLNAPRPEQAISVQRVMDDALSVTTANTVSLRVRNELPKRLRVLVRDEPPAEFTLDESQPRQAWMTLGPFDV